MADRTKIPRTQTDLRANAVTVPSVRVTVIPPGGAAVQASLGLEPLVIGTHADCDLVIVDPRVSRRHCQLSLSERGVVLKDLASRNGTFAGGVEVVEALLPEGVAVIFGGSRLSIGTAGAPTPVRLSVEARFGDALGGSVTMRALFAKLEPAAKSNETILLLGECGTGKESLAKGIHDASSRRGRKYVVFDCTAVPAGLIEAALFGHEKGAFTGADRARPGVLEEADGGTLFMDEIGELPLDLQPKLLRALENGTFRRVGGTETGRFDARIVAATNRDLRERIDAGAFRQDLYYRLAVIEVHVPPLRQHKDDIPLLVERFLAERDPPLTLDDLPPNALELFAGHDWPGNVRELRNMVARLVVLPQMLEEMLGGAASTSRSEARAGRLGELLSHPLREARDLAVKEFEGAPVTAKRRRSLREARELAVEEFERAYVAAKLREHGGNIPRAAKAMGVSRQFAHRLVVKYGLKGTDGESG